MGSIRMFQDYSRRKNQKGCGLTAALLKGFLVGVRIKWQLFIENRHFAMASGLHKCSLSMATRPQPPQTYCMAASLSRHICLGSASGAPQNEHFLASPQGLHRCPGSLATAPQFLHEYDIAYLLFRAFILSLISNLWLRLFII